MKALLRGLGMFLIGCLVLAVIIYVVNLILGMLVLPPAVAQITLIILGLLGLLAVLYLAVNAFRNTGLPLD